MLRMLRVEDNSVAAGDEYRLRNLLQKRLQILNALLIFDDVGVDDRRVVKRLVVSSAERVKYLLTSQELKGWKGYCICEIEKINHCTAQTIIAKQAGLLDGEIPAADKEIVDEIIDATDFHPLALATIATAVHVYRGVVRQGEWVDMKENLLSYLKDEDMGARAVAFGEAYPRSVFASMMYATQKSNT